MTFTDAKQRFSSRVADYVRYRPSYPAALMELLRRECDLRPGHVVADIGSGTGFLTELFLKNGNRVYGVEPNPEMRQAGEEYLASYDGFISVNGSAEETTLGDAMVDFITAGQSFHWFEPASARGEFLRILKPGGWVVAIWNVRERQSSFGKGYEDILIKYAADYKRVRDSWRGFFAGDKFSARTLVGTQLLDSDELAGLLRSASYAPREGQPNFSPMMEELRGLFLEHQQNGRVAMTFNTEVYFGQLSRMAT
jgi:SAM-dependent methyltransferase